MSYSLSNKWAKNLCKWTVLVPLITEHVVTCFLRHSVVSESGEGLSYNVGTSTI